MHVPTPPPNAEAMTPAERLAYLRSRGVEVDVVRDMTKKPAMPPETSEKAPTVEGLNVETVESAAVPPPAPTFDDDDEDSLSPDERLAYLRERGVEVETSEDRQQKKEVVPLRGAGEFVYLKLPHTPTENVSRLHGPVSKGDSLLTLLKPVFADTTVMDRRAVERETTDRLSKMLSQQSVEAPSFDTLQALASEEGHVEAYPLARDSSSGRHVSSLY